MADAGEALKLRAGMLIFPPAATRTMGCPARSSRDRMSLAYKLLVAAYREPLIQWNDDEAAERDAYPP